MEEIEEGIVLFDDEFEVIKQNHKFTDLLNKIGKNNPMEVFFGAEISALKEGTEDLKKWYEEKNLAATINRNDTIHRNKDYPKSSGITLYNLLSKMFPTQTKKFNPFLKILSISQQSTINLRNLDSQNLKERIKADDLNVDQKYKKIKRRYEGRRIALIFNFSKSYLLFF